MNINTLQLTEDLKKARQQIDSLTTQLNRANTNSKTQVSILKAAQKNQVSQSVRGLLYYALAMLISVLHIIVFTRNFIKTQICTVLS